MDPRRWASPSALVGPYEQSFLHTRLRRQLTIASIPQREQLQTDSTHHERNAASLRVSHLPSAPKNHRKQMKFIFGKKRNIHTFPNIPGNISGRLSHPERVARRSNGWKRP